MAIEGFNSIGWEVERDIDVCLLRVVLTEVEGAIGNLPAELREFETRLCLCLCEKILSAGGTTVEPAKKRERRNSEGD